MFGNRNITDISIKYLSTTHVLLYFILIYLGIRLFNAFEHI